MYYVCTTKNEGATVDDMDNIYSAANIERSRGRARAFRKLVADGTLPTSYLGIADEMDTFANERELMSADA